jgi:hypothetical protein
MSEFRNQMFDVISKKSDARLAGEAGRMGFEIED